MDSGRLTRVCISWSVAIFAEGTTKENVTVISERVVCTSTSSSQESLTHFNFGPVLTRAVWSGMGNCTLISGSGYFPAITFSTHSLGRSYTGCVTTARVVAQLTGGTRRRHSETQLVSKKDLMKHEVIVTCAR